MPDEPEIEPVENGDGVNKENDTSRPSNVERSYYYDDAHGYEDFDPDDEEKTEKD